MGAGCLPVLQKLEKIPGSLGNQGWSQRENIKLLYIFSNTMKKVKVGVGTETADLRSPRQSKRWEGPLSNLEYAVLMFHLGPYNLDAINCLDPMLSRFSLGNLSLRNTG